MRGTSSAKFKCLLGGLMIVFFTWVVSESDMFGFAGRLCSCVLKLRVWEGVSENGREDMWSRVGLVSHLVFGLVGRLCSCVLKLGV